MERKTVQKKAGNKRSTAVKSTSPPKKKSKTVSQNNLRKNRRKRQRQRKRNGCLAFVLGIVIIGGLFYLLINGFSKWADDTWDSLLQIQVTRDVYEYEPEVAETAQIYGIEAYTDILLAIMMQESKGRGPDPMQSSECVYNTEYEQIADGIRDPHYSIDCGVRYFSDCISDSHCAGPEDTEALKLAIQGYNYGTGYIHWALDNYGCYSTENVSEFSDKMAAELGISQYGDKGYVVKVLGFYEQILQRENKVQ